MSDHYPSFNPDNQRPYDADPQQNCSPPPDFTSGDQVVPSNDKARHSGTPTTRIKIAHPYARLFAKTGEVKRRKIWNHALEKSLFSPYEFIGFWPVAFEELEPFRGLNSKTAKSMVAGLQHDASIAKLKLLELERANDSLQNAVMHDVYQAF